MARTSKSTQGKAISELFISDRTFPRFEAERVIRVLILSLVDQVGAHSQHLKDPKKTEALHDTRVALRQLRSSIKIYAREMGPEIADITNQQLKTLASQTGAARDAEVQLAWLTKKREDLPGNRRAALNAFAKILKSASSSDYSVLRSTWIESLEEAMSQLIQRLSSPSKLSLEKPSRNFEDVFSELSERYSKRLLKVLSKISSIEDTEQMHEARIRAKYLRYLLAPFASVAPKIEEACSDLKKLQEVLGKLRDVQLLKHSLETVPAEIRGRSGYGDLLDMVAGEEAKLFRRFEGSWDEKKLKKFEKMLRLIAKAPFKDLTTE